MSLFEYQLIGIALVVILIAISMMSKHALPWPILIIVSLLATALVAGSAYMYINAN